MCVQYIEAEIELDRGQALSPQVEQALQVHGEPLRWAIVEADKAGGPVRVEAVVVRA
ncbi:hypothetical protein [Gloeobacter morelensis]|uniref:Uncharacterized protein n=1 Tax=Gloeobacter morelensis MG652769 TaxID=2781736 RepID=A0ABY3PIA4_9CYAN|nr:hypothetical protein [Gloeobacter morelensis]UFP93400.1 hypothetical protein ISF26_16565 [Gloeobacter morelensis MG652769]